MNVRMRAQISLSTLRYLLFSMIVCYLPHLTTTLGWISMLAVAAVSYRLLIHYQYCPPLPLWCRGSIMFFALALLRWQYGTFMSSGFFISTLVAFFWLKLIELYTLRDIRVLILCSFYVIFTALILHTSLWILLYLVVCVLTNMALLIKIEAPNILFKLLAERCIKPLCIAIPISLFMFFLFPRISEPFWRVNLPQAGQTGFTEKMSPGSLAQLFTDDSIVMRVSFNRQANPNTYWEGLVLSQYDGVNWLPEPSFISVFKPLPLLATKQAADYEIILEPHQKSWLFFSGTPIAGWPNLIYSPSVGLTRADKKSVYQRFAYGITTSLASYPSLSQQSQTQYLQLPSYANPKLRAWAVQEKNKASSNKSFITNLLKHINHQPFWYRLAPAAIGQDYKQLDRFWFETREGYCEYYASAMTFILRAAGVPARVVIGYSGGEWNPLAQYLTVRQKNAHAWVEYWQEGQGWQRVDPTRFIDKERIDETIAAQTHEHDLAFYSEWEEYRAQLSWFERIKLSLDSAKFFSERWLLFYNQERQQALLDTLGLSGWQWQELFEACISCFLIFFLLTGLWYHSRQHRRAPLVHEYQRLQQQLTRLHIYTKPPASFSQQLHELADKQPQLKSILDEYLQRYEALRLRKNDSKHAIIRKETKLLFKSLRETLRKL